MESDQMLRGDRVQLKLVIEAGEDARERQELTAKLRRELLRLDVYAVERPPSGEAPPGTRAFEFASVGTLLVTFGKTAEAIGSVVAAVRSWLTARGAGIVKMEIGGDAIEVTGKLSTEQKMLVEAWIKAHERR